MYVMLLTGVSCDDAFEFSDNQTTVVQSHDSDSSDFLVDLCSPFCSCTCCVGFDKPKGVITKTVLPETVLAEIPYQEKAYSSESSPLFQPPKA